MTIPAIDSPYQSGKVKKFLGKRLIKLSPVKRLYLLVLNSGQDSSTICKLRMIKSVQIAWRHLFTPNKKVGDHWADPEYPGGHPVIDGGIPLVNVNGKWVDPNAQPGDPSPGLIYSLEAGILMTPKASEFAPPPVKPFRTAG